MFIIRNFQTTAIKGLLQWFSTFTRSCMVRHLFQAISCFDNPSGPSKHPFPGRCRHSSILGLQRPSVLRAMCWCALPIATLASRYFELCRLIWFVYESSLFDLISYYILQALLSPSPAIWLNWRRLENSIVCALYKIVRLENTMYRTNFLCVYFLDVKIQSLRFF